MSAPFSCTAHQRPIGQGGFYSASLGFDGCQDFTFVYDCGSMTDATRLADEIGVFGCELGNRKLDLLVLSHLDADHVNGVDVLLKSVGGVTDVFLPYLSPLERMLCMLSNSYQSRSYYRFLVDPVATLRRLGAENVYLVGGDDGEEGNAVTSESNGPPQRPRDLKEAKGVELKLDKAGLVSDPSNQGECELEPILGDGIPTQFISDKGYMSVSGFWKLRMFQKEGLRNTLAHLLAVGNYSKAQPGETTGERRCRELLREIAKVVAPKPLTNAIILAKMRTPVGRTLLRKAYAKIAKVHNEVSLCLWHGPEFEVAPDEWEMCGRAYGITALSAIVGSSVRYGRWGYHNEQCGTMLTGDLSLKSRTLEKFLNHYAEELPRTWLLQVPHHGSRHNLEIDRRLFNYRRLGFTSAGLRNQYLHPHLDVVERLESEFDFNVLWSHERRGVTFNLEFGLTPADIATVLSSHH